MLDLGCGNGVPVCRDLAQRYEVTGVDLSEVQIARAAGLVPRARFVLADIAAVAFRAGCLDAILCLYTLIHLPLEDQPLILAKVASWLRPGGMFVATLGHRSWTGSERNWLGGEATMYWSHADAHTYRRWITDAGLQVLREGFVEEGAGGHSLFWARKPPANDTSA